MARRAREIQKAHKSDDSALDERRRIERRLRMGALACWGWLATRGMSRAEAARHMGIASTTLAKWESGWEQDRLRVLRRGMPPDHADPEVRNGVIAFIHLVGPGVGLPTLQAAFPDVARAELERLLERYRMTYLAVTSAFAFALRWTRVGAVWAMDFKQAPSPVDGCYGWVLAVRDLASGKTLASDPYEGATAQAVVATLRRLFRLLGAPLVIKCDNGSHFVNGEVMPLLEAWGVVCLLSPPYFPSYNGSIESGIGSLTIRANHAAARNDRPGEWTCDDVEEARLSGNALGRPRGIHGPTPNEAWNGRPPILDDERVAFHRLVADCEAELKTERGFLPGIEPSPIHNASLCRESVSRALVARGLLLVRRRRIPPPLFTRRMKKIS